MHQQLLLTPLSVFSLGRFWAGRGAFWGSFLGFFRPFSGPARQTAKTLIFDDSTALFAVFWSSRAPKIEPEGAPKSIKNKAPSRLGLLGASWGALGRSWWAFWALLGRSWRLLSPRMAPKRPPGGSREAPRRPKWSRKGLRMSPRRRQAFEKAPENSWEHRGATENARRARAAREQGPHAKTA